MKTLKWPLNVNNFSLMDRLKICSFFLNSKNRWTQDEMVREFELRMANFVGAKHAIFCSSGSTANTMLAMSISDRNPRKKLIVFPSTTWTTSVSPFIREGFYPVFIDINLDDFCFDYEKLEAYVSANKEDIACIFPTSLLGFVPDIKKLKEISFKYDVRMMMDNCENTMGLYEGKNVSSFFTSTTSTYFGHQIQSVEGGFVFTDCNYENDYFLMLRNHGMTRSVPFPQPYNNPDVDSKFDFYLLGNNFRNSDINALIGLIDLSKAYSYQTKRIKFYELYSDMLSGYKYVLPKIHQNRMHVPFCLPVICKKKELKQQAELKCFESGIETRPIISGNLLRQTCYKKYADYSLFPNSEFLHQNGFYIGLHSKLNKEDILDLIGTLNTI
jgi:CDP-6-deoxy-D-xylo-4-hexulose-3-dehydrase